LKLTPETGADELLEMIVNGLAKSLRKGESGSGLAFPHKVHLDHIFRNLYFIILYFINYSTKSKAEKISCVLISYNLFYFFKLGVNIRY